MNTSLDKRLAILGPISIDYNIEPDGHEQKEYGGAIVYAAHAASAIEKNPIIIVKGEKAVIEESEIFKDIAAEIIISDSKRTTSIRNEYLDDSHERRISILKQKTDSFCIEDLNNIDFHTCLLGGLIYGDFSDDFIVEISKKGQVALDAQCLLRHDNGSDKEMSYFDWKEKAKVLPYVKYFKADEKEAQVLTECSDRYKAAKTLYGFGAKEVFISHHSEMMVYNGENYYSCPYKPDSLIGRTGRGDTVFSSYLSFRKNEGIEDSLLKATALVSLKMEKTGPFKDSLENVMKYIDRKKLHIIKS